MMRRTVLFFLSALLISTTCLAGFKATDGSGVPAYESSEVTTSDSIDAVFVFRQMNGARLVYETPSPGSWKWYSYTNDPDQLTEVTTGIRTTADATVLDLPDVQQGYAVVFGGLKRLVYVIKYQPVTVTSIDLNTGSDPCNQLEMMVQSNIQELAWYSGTGRRKTLKRTFSLEWNTQQWDETGKSYQTVAKTTTTSALSYAWSVPAPLCDTYFSLTGDQIASFYGMPISFQSNLYRAVAVKANPLATTAEHTGTNEVDRTTASEYGNGSSIEGSAPLTVAFQSNSSQAALFQVWMVYDSPDGTGSYNRYTDENLNYTFTESGKHLVKLFVSNATCQDSASFTVSVSESMLDCPNFFTPRSTPGENDEFRVAYRSLVRFSGTIVNRWGNVLFRWNDPSKGWDGTFKGKAVSPGVYFYLIEATGSEGKVYKRSGDINLLE